MIGIGRSGCPSPLPPNRTGGSPASGSPVGGSPPRGLTDRSRNDAERSHRPRQGHTVALHPRGAVNMASKSIRGFRPVTLAAMVAGGSARRHSHRCRLLRSPHSSSAASVAAGRSEQVPAQDSHPLWTSAFHGALEPVAYLGDSYVCRIRPNRSQCAMRLRELSASLPTFFGDPDLPRTLD
jgi:hypothetical protein